jgi:hypothetical protein
MSVDGKNPDDHRRTIEISQAGGGGLKKAEKYVVTRLVPVHSFRWPDSAGRPSWD